MKSNTLLFLLLASPIAGAGPEDFTNFVRQTDYATFVEWDVQVDTSGTMDPAVSETGALFELWTVHNTTGEEINLDREFVSSYSPTVEMEFITGDPYKAVARTRADQPIQLVVRVDGIPTGMGGALSNAYSNLKVVHSGTLYPEGVLSPYELNGEPAQFTNEYAFDANNELVIDFPAATLAATDSTKTQGIEMFSVQPQDLNNGHGNNADDVDVSNNGNNKKKHDASGSVDDETVQGGRYIVASVLNDSSLQVWPVAEASVSGIDPTKTYQTVPPLSVDLVDLYPDSTTYLRVYKGAPTANPANPIEIGSQAVVINDTIPQDRRMLVSHLDEFLLDTGSYTIEVLHETPFGIDVLNQFYPLQVDFSLEVRGALYSRD